MYQFNHSKYDKYRDETVFSEIHKEYLSLEEEERKANNVHLKKVVEEEFISLMRQDKLFDLMYRRIMYGGSFYKGTKYGEPEEYDLDLILKLPIDYSYIEIDTDHSNHGFVKIKINLSKNSITPEWKEHEEELSSWLSRSKYFKQDAFRGWMAKVFKKAFVKFNETGVLRYLGVALGFTTKYELSYQKSGPAFTLCIETPEGTQIDVDMVPVFEFDHDLGKGYKHLIREYNNTWKVVAKPLKCNPDGQLLWRPCFYEQEKKYLQGAVKPAIRMMKKFRDTRNWTFLASYHIETVFYHELERHQNHLDDYLRSPKTFLFMTALKQLRKAIRKKRLPYFWNPQFNLFDQIDQTKLENYAKDLDRIIAEIDDYIEEDPWILAEKVLSNEEYEEFTEEEGGIIDQLKKWVIY